MAEHFTKNTVSVTKYCSRCKRVTTHRVDAGRIGPCQACIDRLTAEAAAAKNKPPAPEQTNLF